MQPKEEIIDLVKTYVNHKEQLFNNSKNYRQIHRLKSIGRCKELLKFLLDKNPKTVRRISQIVLIHKDHLRAILPYHGNPSYQSSIDKLNTIVDKCTTALNNTPSF